MVIPLFEDSNTDWKNFNYHIVKPIFSKWKGSLYKLVWVDLLLYLLVYYIISFIYRFALPPDQKRVFEDVVDFCESMKGNIPVSFLLGFFVSGVIGRWYNMYMYIPWMNHISYSTMTYVNCGDKEVARDIRLTLMRYINLSWILLMRRISDQIADRFRQLEDDMDSNDDACSKLCCKGRCKSKRKLKHAQQHPWSISQFQRNQGSVLKTPRSPFDGGVTTNFRQTNMFSKGLLTDDSKGDTVDAARLEADEMDFYNAFEGEDEWSIRATLTGFNKDKKIRETFGKIITESEIRAFEAIAKDYFKQTRRRYLPEYWVPLQWAVRLVQKAGLHGNIPDPRMIGYMFKEIGDFRFSLQNLEIYSSIMMPLVYTQVVIIAVYSYFACEIMASQFVEKPVDKSEAAVDFFVPVFSIFYFLFLMGWLKVALCVMNPFGDDDEDFETSEILNHNLDVSYRSVLMDDSTFPETLTAATFELKPMKGVEDDNMFEFMRQVKEELEASEVVDMDELTNLEIRQRCCSCFKGVKGGKDEGTLGHKQTALRLSIVGPRAAGKNRPAHV